MAPYGSQLDPIWIQMDPRWIHLDFIWIPSGSHMDPYNSQMDPFGSQIDPIWIHIMDPHGIHMGSIQKCRLKAKRPEAARLQTCAQQGPKQMCKNASGMCQTRCQACGQHCCRPGWDYLVEKILFGAPEVICCCKSPLVLQTFSFLLIWFKNEWRE